MGGKRKITQSSTYCARTTHFGHLACFIWNQPKLTTMHIPHTQFDLLQSHLSLLSQDLNLLVFFDLINQLCSSYALRAYCLTGFFHYTRDRIMVFPLTGAGALWATQSSFRNTWKGTQTLPFNILNMRQVFFLTNNKVRMTRVPTKASNQYLKKWNTTTMTTQRNVAWLDNPFIRWQVSNRHSQTISIEETE